MLFNRILAPLDGSTLAECVLPHLIVMAQAFGSQVTLMRVLDPYSPFARPNVIDPVDWQIRRAEAAAYLEDIASRLRQAGIEASYEVFEGKAAEQIIQQAAEEQAGLVILASHGQSGLSPWNVSSTVQQVILRLRCSVMIVRAFQPQPEPGEPARYRRILLPLDGSPRSEIVLPVVTALANAQGSQINLVHIVQKPDLPRRTPPSQEDLALVDRLVERNTEEAQKYLDDLQGRLGVPASCRLVVSSQVMNTLQSLADEEHVDLVLLSAHGYSGESHWPYTSLVIGFIAYGADPLLVIQDLRADLIEPTRAEQAAVSRGER